MKQSTKTYLGILVLILTSVYLLINSDYYQTNELEHLDDRIKFGRLQYHRKIDLNVGKLQIHNRQKIFTINFDNQPLFVGEMEHFLVLMQAKGTIKNNGDNIFDIQDDIQKICKIQRVLNIYPDQQALTVELQGSFQDCKDAQYKIIFKQTDDNKLRIHVIAPQKYQRAYLFFHHEKSNHYYGLGEQFSYLNLGHDRPFSTFTRQKGIGRGKQPLTLIANLLHGAGGSYFTSQAPAPIWISSKRAAYILNSHHYMAWINNKVLVWSNNFTITYIKKKTYKQLIKQISQINGYTPPVPQWVNKGAIVGIQGTPKEVLNKYLTLRQQGAKIIALQLQDWVSKRQSLGYSKYWWNYQITQQHINDWNRLTDQLKTDKVQILIQISSMLTDPSSNPKVKKNLYKIAQEMGYFVKLKNHQNFRTKAFSELDASLINFQNEQGVKFFKYLIEHALNDTAANGVMADFSQAYPIQAVSQTIQQGVTRHNQYPNIYLEKVHKIMQEIRGQNNDFYIFSKAGHLNSPKYTGSLWTGDHSMNFDFHTGLPSCLTAILSSGLVGYSNTHCDIGGHIGFKRKYVSSVHRSQILLLRWMQLSAFTSIFRNHEENLPESTLEVYSNRLLSRSFAFYSQVFEILSKYRKQQSEKSQKMGLPLVRALFLQLDGQQGTEQIQDQFYMGEQILVVPYLNEQNERKYFLPKGEWKVIWDGKVYKGCDCERRWKDNLPPVFIRSSSKFTDQIINDIGSLIQLYKDVVYEISSRKQSDL